MNLLPDTDSEDELPEGWEQKISLTNRIYFVNKNTNSSQWNHPITGKRKAVSSKLPEGWQKKFDENNSVVYFQNVNTGQTTYSDPRLASAYELSNNIPGVPKGKELGPDSTTEDVLEGKNFSGKNVIVTGANSGIGFETAKAFASHGAHVIMACRDREKANQAINLIKSEYENSVLTFLKCDLNSLESVCDFCNEFQMMNLCLDILILNAAVTGIPYTLTQDGYEMTFQVNHLSHFYMIRLLEEILIKSGTRIVFVSSESHRFSTLTVDNINEDINPWTFISFMAYNDSKLCNILTAKEFQRRLGHQGITAVSCHPGNLVYSNIQRNWWFLRLIYFLTKPFTKTANQGAATVVYCAITNDSKEIGGLYFNNCQECEPSSKAKDTKLAKELWSKSTLNEKRMNLELLEQFGQNYPEEFDGILDCVAHGTVAAFNRRGSVLAVGSNDGRVFIWDFLTRGIANIIQAHVKQISSLSWSRNGRLLASGSEDSWVYVWDVLKSTPLIKWHLETPLLSVQFNPRNQNILLIHAIRQPSRLVHYEVSSDGTGWVWNFKNGQRLICISFLAKTIGHANIPHDDESDFDCVSSFDKRGEYVFSGNTKGRIQVIRLEKGTIKYTIITSFRVSNTQIKQIEFAPKKKDIFLVNGQDRIIRVYNTNDVLSNCSNSNAKTRRIPDPEPIQKLQDLINRTSWKKCCFSGGSESDYICAGSSRENALYIWDRNIGTLLKILQGPKGEIVSDVIWHPVRPVIASIASGVVSIYTQAQIENWSAFAPDFKELEENIVYEERESEFDEFDEDRTPTRADPNANDDEDNIIDVVTPHSIDAFLSSDEEEEDHDALIYFPMIVDMDEVELESGDNFFDENILSNVSNKLQDNEQGRQQLSYKKQYKAIEFNDRSTKYSRV